MSSKTKTHFIWQAKSLQQRITLFLLVPVCLLMVIMGLIGFLFARNIILQQWGETAVANLQKAAHMIDMRLGGPKEILQLIHNEPVSEQNHLFHEFLIEQIKTMDGIVAVRVQWPEVVFPEGMSNRMSRGKMMLMKYSRMSKIQTSLPEFNPDFKSETVSISSDYIGKNGRRVGGIEVVIEFNDLIDQILKTSWWQSNKTFIIDDTGYILSSSTSVQNKNVRIYPENRKFGHTTALEMKTLKALQKQSQGIVFGSGHPPVISFSVDRRS